MRCLVLIVYDMDVSVMGNSTCPMWYGDYSTCPMWYEDYLYGAKLLNEIKGCGVSALDVCGEDYLAPELRAIYQLALIPIVGAAETIVAQHWSQSNQINA
ncbi:hypothetical protein Lal_00039250 [Lupinus albus]|nr:hypothetical protein Lal_00039250 [Lupinus albus]